MARLVSSQAIMLRKSSKFFYCKCRNGFTDSLVVGSPLMKRKLHLHLHPAVVVEDMDIPLYLPRKIAHTAITLLHLHIHLVMLLPLPLKAMLHLLFKHIHHHLHKITLHLLLFKDKSKAMLLHPFNMSLVLRQHLQSLKNNTKVKCQVLERNLLVMWLVPPLGVSVLHVSRNCTFYLVNLTLTFLYIVGSDLANSIF